MRQVDLGYGAIALEPSEASDRVESVSEDSLENLGLGAEILNLYKSYRSRVIASKAESAHEDDVPEFAPPA